MKSFAAGLRGLPFLARWGVVSAVSCGVLGAIAGLVIGLLDYAPTAPVAMFELGLPAAVAGGVAGFAAGLIAAALGRIRPHRARPL